LSAAKGGVHRGQSLWDLISSRFEYFLAFFVVSLSTIVIVVALIVPIIDPSLSQPAVQGMIAIVSGVIGFFFGNRGAERAEEQVREIVTQLARGGAVGIQQKRIKDELGEIRAKVEMAIDQAQAASELQADNRYRDADRHFDYAGKLIEDSCNAMKAWIYANHAYVKLEVDKDSEALEMFKKSEECHKDIDVPNDLFPKRTCYGLAVAQIYIDDSNEQENAIQSLNRIGNDIVEMDDLFDPKDISKFLNSSSINKLDPKIKKYLEKVKKRFEKEERKDEKETMHNDMEDTNTE
jgi:hypothetical protein